MTGEEMVALSKQHTISEWSAQGAVDPIPVARAEGIYQLVLKEPVGPVAAFTPWNFPINQVVRKLSAAVATGCSIIVKAPEETPASPAELIRAFIDAGLPAGVANLVYGVPAEISSYLIAHPIIRKVTFTGSTPVGKQLAALAGQHLLRVDGTRIHAVRAAVAVGVRVRHPAPARPLGELARIVRAQVAAVRRAVVVAVRVRHPAAAQARGGLGSGRSTSHRPSENPEAKH
jgi:hypothetical protein